MNLIEHCLRPAPTVPPCQGEVILCQESQRLLAEFSGKHECIIEIGSWIGFSALMLAKWNPQATIVCIDPWFGSCELLHMDGLGQHVGQSYDQFLANTDHLKERIWPLRMTGVDGMVLCHKEGFIPTLIFIDGSHEYEMVWGDIHAARRLFPKAMLVLDDLMHPGPSRAVAELIPSTIIERNAGVFFP